MSGTTLCSLVPRLLGGGGERAWYTLLAHARVLPRLSRVRDIVRARPCHDDGQGRLSMTRAGTLWCSLLAMARSQSSCVTAMERSILYALKKVGYPSVTLKSQQRECIEYVYHRKDFGYPLALESRSATKCCHSSLTTSWGVKPVP